MTKSHARPLLSVCLITRNEERFIRQCLQSIVDIANEIVVVDAYSQDQTVQIAKEYDAQVYLRHWNDDFAAARNYAIDRSNGHWILFLDADEALINPGQLINHITTSSHSKLGGYFIERRDCFRHRENGKVSQYAVGIVRLFKNLPELRYKYKIHEQINSVILDNDLQIDILYECRIAHDVQGSSDAQLDKKQKYYLKLLEQSLQMVPDDSWLIYHKAKTLWYFKHHEHALRLFSNLSNDSATPLDIRTSSTNQCAVLLLEQGKYKEALSVIEKSIALIPEQSMAYAIAYNIYYQINSFDKAIQQIKRVKTTLRRCSWHHVIPGDLYVPADVQQYRIGCAHLALGSLKQAKQSFQLGLSTNPNNSDNYYGLTIIFTEEGDIVNARIHLEHCLHLNPAWNEALDLKQLLDNTSLG